MNSSNIKNCLLVNVLSNPKIFSGLTIKNMELVIRQANSGDLLASLSYRIKNSGTELSTLPQKVQTHFEAINNVAEAHEKFIQWEIKILEKLFDREKTPLVLLKGAAYTALSLPCSKGRLYGDIDLLVNKKNLFDVEVMLKRGLWLAKKMDAYDEKYFRKWMHEIPPLHHMSRRSVLDVHHALLPDTCKLKPDSQKIFSQISPITDTHNIYTLSPVDMTLHSMAHLFHEGELEHGLRDLVDIDLLLTHFSHIDNSFWAKLNPRAKELNLETPLYYGLRYSEMSLNTTIPPDVLNESINKTPFIVKLMDFLFLRALLPHHKSCNSLSISFARWVLYVRSHYLRMPLYLLIPHLLRKWNRKRNSPNADA